MRLMRIFPLSGRTAPSPATRRRTFRASLRRMMALPRWVFRSLAVLGCTARAATLGRAIPDLRPQNPDVDLRYDV
jgi:hypothetical protein